jgi:hypothetical protein
VEAPFITPISVKIIVSIPSRPSIQSAYTTIMVFTAPFAFDAVAADLYPDPASICDWAVEQCYMVGTTGTIRTCQRVGCSKYIHHVCSIEWALKNKLPEGGIATLCRAHHPHYTKFVAAAAAAAASTASNSITGGVISPTCPTASMDLTDILNGASGIPRANDYEEPPPSLCVSPAENHFIDNNRTMLSLAAMCIGALDNDGLQLVDPDACEQRNVSYLSKSAL